MSGRIAVGVSGAGSNLQALHASAGRGELGGEIVLVFADHACPALDWATEQGIDTALVPGGDDAALDEALAAARADVVVLAGYMRIVGPPRPGRLPGPDPQHAPLAPARVPGRARGRGTPSTMARRSPAAPSTSWTRPSTAARSSRRRRSRSCPATTPTTLHARIRAVEHRLLPRAVGLLLAGALSVAADGRHVILDLDRADSAVPRPRRALLSVSDKTGLVDLGRGLLARGFELISTGGTARALRDADLPVTDVAAVTGFPEMLDGRVKTLHPRVHGGLLADRRLDDHRHQIIAAAIAPFELVVVNLYPFAAALERPGITVDELIEEIDIGGPSMVRAAAKNHANVAIVDIAGTLRRGARRPGRAGRYRRCAPSGAGARGVRPHRGLRRPDRDRAAGALRVRRA